MKKSEIRRRLASANQETAAEELAALAAELQEETSAPVEDQEVEDVDDEVAIEQDDEEVDDLMDEEDGDEEADEEEADEEDGEEEADEEVDANVPDEKEIVSAECDALSAKIARLERRASQVAQGVQDTIGDQVHGGDPSTSEIAPGGKDVDVSTDKEVFPTNSQYVASITKRLDRVASVLEKRGLKRMAFRIDKLSDKLEASIR